MDEKIIGGVILLVGGVLYFNGVPQKAWAALWGSSKPLAATLPADTGVTNDTTPPASFGTPGAGGNAEVSAANSFLGKTQAFGQNVIGMCLQFVDNVAASVGIPIHRYGSAIQAEQAGPVNSGCNAPAGSFVYFDTSWDPSGHVGISNGDGTMTSALSNGVTRSPYCVAGYLGWSNPR